jgi:carboxymethylenebutenolidase|tara:strand:+ start:1103 stop:1282 length:180 start_codon:yes stop_codon:yes gene_type:complete
MHKTHFYPEVNHGFQNKPTPKFDKKAANISGEITLNFFKKHLKQVPIILIRNLLVFKLF